MIYIAQLLCPARHCIMATALEYPDGGEPNFEKNLPALKELEKDLFQWLGANRYCGICGSKVLEWEHGKTRFKDKQEAIAAMKVEQDEQLLTKSMLDVMGISFDAKNRLKNN